MSNQEGIAMDHTDAKGDPPQGGVGDTTDARLSSLGTGKSTHGAGTSASNDQTFAYRMDYPNRGYAVIINNKNFDRRTGMNDRSGTDVDAANMYQKLQKLGFNVNMFHNQTCTDMIRIMRQAAQADHRDSDCFACILLSHGDEGIIYGTDGIIPVEHLVAPFKGDACPSLAGKPKIFIIQACRGSQLDHGVEVSDAAVDDDDEVKKQRIPAEADFLMAYSTVPGYFSWRNSTKGSWFIQALTKVLDEYSAKKDLLWMFTRVNHKVAYEFESNASKEYMNRKKQIPSIVSMLTKDIYFLPK